MKPPGKYQLNDSSRFRDLDPGSDEDDVDVGFSKFEELSAVPEVVVEAVVEVVVEVEDWVDEWVEEGVEDRVEGVGDMKRRGL